MHSISMQQVVCLLSHKENKVICYCLKKKKKGFESFSSRFPAFSWSVCILNQYPTCLCFSVSCLTWPLTKIHADNNHHNNFTVIGLDSQDVAEEEEEEEEEAGQKTSKRRGLEIITFTEEQAAELAKDPGEEASMSERILAQSAAERDRISEIKDKAVELETEPKFANCCSYCPKSFKKPSDLVRWTSCLFLLTFHLS